MRRVGTSDSETGDTTTCPLFRCFRRTAVVAWDSGQDNSSLLPRCPAVQRRSLAAGYSRPLPRGAAAYERRHSDAALAGRSHDRTRKSEHHRRTGRSRRGPARHTGCPTENNLLVCRIIPEQGKTYSMVLEIEVPILGSHLLLHL